METSFFCNTRAEELSIKFRMASGIFYFTILKVINFAFANSAELRPLTSSPPCPFIPAIIRPGPAPYCPRCIWRSGFLA